MKCHFCEKDGKPSELYPGLQSIMNSRGQYGFYDSAGLPHEHDESKHWRNFNCSNGHYYVMTYYKECPSCDFHKGETTYKLAQEQFST